MFHYAQINESGICFAISELAGTVIADDMIPITAETDCLGKKWRDGEWLEVEQPEPAPEPLSDQEQLLLDTAINTEYLVTLADLGL